MKVITTFSVDETPYVRVQESPLGDVDLFWRVLAGVVTEDGDVLVATQHGWVDVHNGGELVSKDVFEATLPPF